MTGSTVSFDYTARPPLRRSALGLALAGYLVLFAAGVIALVGLATPVGHSAVIAAAVGVALVLGGIACWAADRVATARRSVRDAPRTTSGSSAVSERRPSRA